jgi:type I restriction enzyme S subunit
MSFPRYESYKDSGVEWLGEVPEHWSHTAMKHVFCYVVDNRGRTPPLEASGIPMLEIKHIEGDGCYPKLVFDKFISQKTCDEFLRCYLDDGDILFGTVGSIGKVSIVPKVFNFIIAQNVVAFRVGKSQHNKYYYHLMNAEIFRGCLTAANKSNIQDSIKVSDILQERFCVPPYIEQQTIAAFLDRETAKIDALIAEQQRLIELLKEKRQAVISHAVTKGLTPDAPMKDSGIEWLGEVPEHWEVKQLRHFAEVLRGKFTHRPRNDPAFYDGEYPFIQTGDITGSSRLITGYKQTLNERGISVSKEFPRGTLVMAIAANIGDVAILDFPAYFPDSIVGLVPNDKSDLMFLFYLMMALKQPMLMSATVSTQMNLNVDQICSLIAPCPPLEEQSEIFFFLDNETIKLDTLTAEAKRGIELLQERRTALISAAVTGKIDVRGLVSTALPEEAAA